MSRSTYLPRLSSLLLLVLLLLPLSAFAQFNFGNMFNQQQQQHQQHHQQADPSRNRGWQAQKDIPCNKYLCPATFDCVEYPSHCPCPYPEDRKCFLPVAPGEAQHDASFVCQRGPTEKGCEDVRKRAMGRW